MRRKYSDRPYRRNVLTKEGVDARIKAGCPCCAGKLVPRMGTHTDKETGERYRSGSFLGCENYGKSCDAEYSMSFDKQRLESWYE